MDEKTQVDEGRERPPEPSKPQGLISGVDASGSPEDTCDWLVLIYMDISGPELVEPAKAEIFELLAANFDAPGDLPATASVQVIVQTTGFLLDGRSSRGTRRYRIADGRLIDLSPREVGAKFGERESLQSLPPDPFRGEFNYPISTGQSLDALVFDGWKSGAPKAKRRMLILWGHGAGVGVGLDLTTLSPSSNFDDSLPLDFQAIAARFRAQDLASRSKWISPQYIPLQKPQRPGQERQPGINAMTSAVIEEAMGRAGVNLEKDRFDVVVFDSCFLSSAEMAFQVRKITRYFVASQGMIGFPTLDLTRVLRSIQARGLEEADLLELGKSIVDQALDASSSAVGLSLFRCHVEGWGDPPWDFMLRLRGLVAALRFGIWIPELREDIREAFRAAAFVEVRQFVDVVDLAVRLQKCREPRRPAPIKYTPIDSELFRQVDSFERDICEKLSSEIRLTARNLVNLLATPNGFLAYHQSRRLPTAAEQGISIYVPWFRSEAGGANAKVDPDIYANLDLSRYSRWPDFIYSVSPEDTEADVAAEEELHRLQAAIAGLSDFAAFEALDTKRDRLDTKRDRLDTKRDRLARGRDD